MADVTFILPDGTPRTVNIDTIASIRPASGGSRIPALERLGAIVTYTDGERDAVHGSYAEICMVVGMARIAARLVARHTALAAGEVSDG